MENVQLQLRKSVDELEQEKREHEYFYLNKIRVQYNEALLTKNNYCLVDLTAALSKARKISSQISKDIIQKKRQLEVTTFNYLLLSFCL